MSTGKIITGKKGEDLAENFLRKAGYKILERNYKTKYGEIDIIGSDKNCTVFIEVRSQNAEEFDSPEETVTKRKQNQIAKSALSYIKRFSIEDTDCRFDVVCIQKPDTSTPDIRLIKDAFELNLRYKY